MGEAALDVAVVGAGVAGLRAAELMSQARPDWRIGIFERSSRPGGRLLSVRMPVASGVAELGGMRFRTSQPLVTGLVAELGLAMRPFRTVDDDNRFLLRGASWRAAQAQRASEVYRLSAGESGLSPAELLVAAFERIVPGAGSLDDDGWLEVKRSFEFRGAPLRDWAMHDALAAVLSADAHRYVLDGFGYSTVLAGRNAADAIPWVLIEARPETENHTLVDGMEALPRAQAARLTERGCGLHLEREVVSVDTGPAAGEPFRLSVAGGDAVGAKRVVLALPARALERLAAGSPLLASQRLRRLYRSVTAHDAAKLFLSFDRAWWRERSFHALRAVTDLPLSKVYYFDRGEGDGLLLAAYSDGSVREAWAGLADRVPRPVDRLPFGSAERWRSYAASEEQVAQACGWLAVLHRLDRVPAPVAATFIDWGAEGRDGAWHVWDPRVRSWEVMDAVARPLPEHDLYICNEAFSWSQGWVEGALESAERAAAQVLEARPVR